MSIKRKRKGYQYILEELENMHINGNDHGVIQIDINVIVII